MSVTVKEMRECLADLPEDAVVVMASDPEGNGYSPLDGIEDDVYYREPSFTGRRGGVMVEIEGEYQDAFSLEKVDNSKGLSKAVILWPSH